LKRPANCSLFRPAWAGGYIRNGARLILAEVLADQGQAAVDELIRKFDFENLFGLKPGTVFRKPV